MTFMRSVLGTFVAGGLAATAFGAADNYAWIGGGSPTSDWRTSSNWAGDVELDYPGQVVAGDTALIDIAANTPVFISGSVPNSVSTVTLDADAHSATVELELRSSGSLTTTGLVLVMSEQAGTDTATLDLQAGATFAPSSLRFDGAASVSNGHAIGLFAESFTVANGITISSGYANFTVALNEVVTVSGAFTVDADANFALSSSGSGADAQISAASYVQNGGTSGSIASVGANAQIVTN